MNNKYHQIKMFKNYNQDQYSNKLLKEISNTLFNENNQVIKFIIGDNKYLYKYNKKLIIKKCPMCNIKWKEPLDHILNKCNKLPKIEIKTINDLIKRIKPLC